MTHVPDPTSHPPDAAVRTLIDSLVDGSFSRSRGHEQARSRKELFAALGPVTSVDHLRSDQSGDVHLATFTHGRMLCMTQRDEGGKISHFELTPG
jgi:hypothetical protein